VSLSAQALFPDALSGRRSFLGHHPSGSAPKLLHEHPEVKIVVLSMEYNPQYLRDAFAAGASGYDPKEAAETELTPSHDE
jgi:hypothetical protein